MLRVLAAILALIAVGCMSVAIVGTGHTLTRDVAPGEAIFIDLEGIVHARQCAEHPSLNPCMFEYVYLARPDSIMDGVSVYQARLNLGETLAQRLISTMPPIAMTSRMPISDRLNTAAVRIQSDRRNGDSERPRAFAPAPETRRGRGAAQSPIIASHRPNETSNGRRLPRHRVARPTPRRRAAE